MRSARAPLALAASLVASTARAEPEPVRFSWVRGEGADVCAAQPKIAEQVAARVGEGAISPGAARSVEVVVSRAERGFRAAIHVRDAAGRAAGSREIASDAEDCGPLEAASVLAIAIAIDPEALTRPPRVPSPAPVSVPAPASVPAPVSVPAPAVVPAPAPPPALGSGAALRVGAAFGLLPAVSSAFSLAAHVAIGARAGLTGEATWLPEARTSDGRFGFGLAALSLGACVTAVKASAADLAACGALWAGAMHAVVYEMTPVAPGDYAWAAASVTPRLRVRLAAAVHLELGVHVIAPFVRRAFAVSAPPEQVFQQPPVTALAFGGLGAHFP